MKKENDDINYWEKAVKNLPPPYLLWFDEEERMLKKYVEKNSRILDVGCGDGRSLKILLPITKNLIGLDHDEEVVIHAQNSFKNNKEVKIISGEGINLPFENDSFDLILCLGTFANLGSERLGVLNEMIRVLKKGGLMFIGSYSENALEERLKLYKREKVVIKEMKKNGTILFEGAVDAISEQFSKEELISIFNKVKLGIKEIRMVGEGIGYVCVLEKCI